jgi:hypothetical protein
MTYERAVELAQRCANRTGSSTLVYLATHNLSRPEEVRYGYDFTLPTWGKRIGDRIYPNGFDESSQEDFEEANRNAVLNNHRAAMAWADIDAALEEPLNEACERLNDCDDDRIEQSRAGQLQGVCKDCGNGSLNNLLSPAFGYNGDDDFAGGDTLVCLQCGSTHLDLL